MIAIVVVMLVVQVSDKEELEQRGHHLAMAPSSYTELSIVLTVSQCEIINIVAAVIAN